MTDEFDRLQDALKAETPKPDGARKAENLRLAAENFDRLQGSRPGTRPIDRPTTVVWLWNGVGRMINHVMTKGGLAATTALVAVAMVWVAQDQGLLGPRLPGTVVLSDGTSTPKSAAETRAEPLQPNTPTRQENSQEAEAPMREPILSEESYSMANKMGSAVSDLAAAPSAVERDRAMIFPAPDAQIRIESDTETFANADPNPLKVTADDPVATFSADVDTASWSIVRSSLMQGALPPADAVRVEEMINYFPYAYPAPEGSHPFQPTVTVTPTPWNPGTNLVHIGIQGALPEIAERPPLNLVFLIDTSGSMQSPSKLPLLKQSFRLMLAELRPEDSISIVTYAGRAGQVLDPTPASERAAILAALDRLEAGGSTAGQAGLEQAYATAEAMTGDGEVTRVILATDGDFNVGLSDPDALKDFIAKKRDSGTYLSVLGFGRGNLDDATMQALAQNGNGQAAYIDTLSEARKVLVDQLTGALFPIANDVKFQVEFNPATVAEYRLIGYETRALAREDFNNDRVDAGDIGAGHTVTAIFEITPVGSSAILTDPLRYQPAQTQGGSDELGFLKLRYKAPGASESILIETPIAPTAVAPGTDVAFSTAIAGFGELLRGSDYLGNWSYSDAIALANGARGDDAFGYRTEAVNLMRLAEALSR